MLRYLAVLAVMLACFMGDVSAVTDQEFQIIQSQHHELSILVRRQATRIDDLEEQLKAALDSPGTEIIQNNTIEERETLLEVQVADIREDITEIDEDVTGLDENVGFLFDEQVIQDERLLNLEDENAQTIVELDQIEDEIESLEDTTLALDFRVTVLEETGGSGGNSSISELEVRVETLEGTAADHETRIISAEENVEELESSNADHETRLTAAEENILGLQMTDINHESRITALEENGGGGSGSQNETIAFYAVLTSYDTIPDERPVEFNVVVLNQGNGYDSTTGVFTVPSGGDGLYFFSTYLLVTLGEYAYFDIQLNGDVICTAYGDHNSSGENDYAQATCSAVVSVIEGDEVKLVRRSSTDNTPLYEHTTYYFKGFNGFRI